MRLDRRSFVKRLSFGIAGLNVVAAWPRRLQAGEWQFPEHLPRSSPEAQGVSSIGIMRFLAAIAKSGFEMHSFMLTRRGFVVAEGWWAPYRADAPHLLYSLSKNFTSTAVGFAVAEGRLSVEDKVAAFFPDSIPSKVSANLAGLRVRDLLTMSAGHADDSTAIITKEQDWVRAFLALPIAHPPGSTFLYDSGNSYMLSAIVQQVSGKKVVDYLRSRLFDPMAIHKVAWEICPRGINTGGWGLSVTTETLAKLGQLYLDKGRWNGRQLLPEKWIEDATSSLIQQPANWFAEPGAALEKLKETSDWHQGYGYQFWQCRHGAFRGDGAFGQFCIVVPRLDATIIITSSSQDLQHLLNVVWEQLLPALQVDKVTSGTTSDSQLRRELANLRLALPSGSERSPIIGSAVDMLFMLEANSLGYNSVRFKFGQKVCLVELASEKGVSRIRCGIHAWLSGVTDVPAVPPRMPEILGPMIGSQQPIKVAAAGAWKNDNTFEMQWRYYETPHSDTVTCQFDGRDVMIKFMNSITQPVQGASIASAAHPETRPILRGQRVP